MLTFPRLLFGAQNQTSDDGEAGLGSSIGGPFTGGDGALAGGPAGLPEMPSLEEILKARAAVKEAFADLRAINKAYPLGTALYPNLQYQVAAILTDVAFTCVRRTLFPTLPYRSANSPPASRASSKRLDRGGHPNLALLLQRHNPQYRLLPRSRSLPRPGNPSSLRYIPIRRRNRPANRPQQDHVQSLGRLRQEPQSRAWLGRLRDWQCWCAWGYWK